jgi:hypothetical protein
MNAYEARQETRRERLEARAQRLEREAAAAFARADLSEAATGIPFGQPILVGHHSERRHRNVIAKANRAMSKGIELQKAATETARRADSVGSGGISSDDPDAIDKLKAELAEVEARIIAENAANRALRKGDWAGVAAAVGQARADSERAFFERWGYAGFHVTNRRANARRIKERIAHLERQAQRAPVAPTTINGVEIIENAELNRLQLRFPGKPSDDIRASLKSCGFRWSPSEGTWQRHLSNAARYQAEQLLS